MKILAQIDPPDTTCAILDFLGLASVPARTVLMRAAKRPGGPEWSRD